MTQITEKKKTLKKKLLITVILLAVFGTMSAVAFGETYMALMFCRIFIYKIAGSGLDILFVYTGQISFGHAAFFAVGAYTSAYFSINLGWSPILTMLIGVVFSMVVGAIIAIPATKLVKHFLSLLTIAFGQLVYTFANSTRPMTGGASGLNMIGDTPAVAEIIDGFHSDQGLMCTANGGIMPTIADGGWYPLYLRHGSRLNVLKADGHAEQLNSGQADEERAWLPRSGSPGGALVF